MDVTQTDKQVICRQCRREIESQIIECTSCNKLFHPSCHKLHKVYNSANELVICFGKCEIITIKCTNTGEGISVKQRKLSNIEDNQVQGIIMEMTID
ncbi:hypothetical protein ANTRET_LOCUS1382 [Anthophora retusa]